MVHFSVLIGINGGLWEAECTAEAYAGTSYCRDVGPLEAFRRAVVDFKAEAGIDIWTPLTFNIEITSESLDAFSRLIRQAAEARGTSIDGLFAPDAVIHARELS